MEKQKEHRTYPRFKCVVPVLILGGKPLKFFQTSMRNFSEGGFYFELSDPLETGDFIVARTDDSSAIDPISAGTWKQRQVKVKWCMEIAAEGSQRYGCGAQYISEE